MTDPAIDALHRGLLTLDSHIDIPWPIGPDPLEDGPRCVDLPKLRRGGVKVACLVAYVPQGPRTPAALAGAQARTEAMLLAIAALGRRGARITPTVAEIEAAAAAGVPAILPAVENGHALGADLAMLARFRALGARYLTLTHNGHNLLADSAIPRGDLGDQPTEHGGLSAFGRTVIAELGRLGMLADVSHASKATMMQAVELSRAPVVATHSCMRALCDHPRNLDDEQLDALKGCGGVAQVTAVPGFLRAGGAGVTLADIADHVDYAVKRIGVEHVGIGSDFDGGGGVAGWRNAAESPNLTAELARRGYGAAELALLWGGNFLRVLRRAEAIAG